jgi:hypothetical protein
MKEMREWRREKVKERKEESTSLFTEGIPEHFPSDFLWME